MCRKLIFLVLLLSLGLTTGVASGQSAAVVRINFQSRTQGSREVPVGYLPDYGDAFGNRGKGWSYGWDANNTGNGRDRDNSSAPDQRYDTFVQMEKGGTFYWEIGLPNGTYNLFIVCGDPSYTDQIDSLDVEGTIITDPTPATGNFDEYNVTVTVTDGRLTIRPKAGNPFPGAKICFIDIADERAAKKPISPPDRGLWPNRTPKLQWTPGTGAVTHDVYLDTDFTDVNNANRASHSGVTYYKENHDVNNYSITGLTPGATYYWRIDEVDADNVVLSKGDIWIFKVQLVTAYDPQPIDGAIFVDPNTKLSWSKGATANEHLVYLGDNYNNVRDATTISPEFKATLPKDTTTWDPPGLLSLNKKYYWRIAEKESGGTVYPGNVWSFTTATRLGGALIGRYYNNATWTEPPTLTRMDPQINFDWGLGSPDPTITNVNAFSVRWIGEIEIPASGEWTFWVQMGATTGRLWVNGQPLLNNTTTITSWYSAAITLEAGFYPIVMEYANTDNVALAQLLWQNPLLVPTRQIIPSGAFTPPLSASNPKPANNATDVEMTPTLSWNPGIKAAKHDVYFSDNREDVNKAKSSDPNGPGYVYKGRQDVNSYTIHKPPAPLKWGQTYYWRIDEVNDPNKWPGSSIWSFTTRNYIVVDDFESYTNSDPNIIYKTWKDGKGYTGYGGNGTGSQAGYRDPNYAEVMIGLTPNSRIHGGRQSMPFDYNNLNPPYDSNVSRTFATPQNWTTDPCNVYSLKSLGLWLRGYMLPVGSFVESAGTYTMTASGTDINTPNWRFPSKWRDEFHYAYIPITGNCDIIVKVKHVSNTNAQAKAGIMIRDSLDDNSNYAMMCITPSNGVRFQRRTTAGGPSTADANVASSITPPYWLRLERYYKDPPGLYFYNAWYASPLPSGEPNNWIQLGEPNSIEIPMTNPIYIGLALTAYNAAATCTAVFSNVSVYDNDGNPVTPSPWTSHQDIGIKSNTAAPLFVTLQEDASVGGDTATVTNNNIDIQSTTWQSWDIVLNDFKVVNPNLDLTKIKKITIGVGNKQPGGKGTLYFDDVRLYIRRCMSGTVPDSASGNCLVDYPDLQILTNNWLISNQVTPAAPSDANLIARYEFEGNFNDNSPGPGHKNNGEPNGATIVTDPVRGNVASFDGINDYVNCANDVSLNEPNITGKVTLAAWVKTNDCGNSEFNPYIAKGDHAYTLQHRTTNALLFSIYDAGAWHDADFPVNSSFNNSWHHLAGTYNGSQIKLYVDGELKTTTDYVGSIASETANVNLGKSSDYTDRFYEGLLDDVRIYSRALSHNEIAYLAGKTMPFTQPLYLLLTPQNSGIDMYKDGRIDLKDYAILASKWLEEVLWP